MLLQVFLRGRNRELRPTIRLPIQCPAERAGGRRTTGRSAGNGFATDLIRSHFAESSSPTDSLRSEQIIQQSSWKRSRPPRHQTCVLCTTRLGSRHGANLVIRHVTRRAAAAAAASVTSRGMHRTTNKELRRNTPTQEPGTCFESDDWIFEIMFTTHNMIRQSACFVEIKNSILT